MDTKILTLRYSPDLGAFDDAPLRALVENHELLNLREHFFEFQELPHLLCVVSCRQRVGVARPSRPPASEANTSPTPTRKRAPSNDSGYPEGLSKFERELYDELRRWRAGIAEHAGVPRFVVLTNRDVEGLVRTLPETLAGLRKIPGFGKAKVEKYGEALLEMLRTEHPPDQAEPASEPQSEPEPS